MKNGSTFHRQRRLANLIGRQKHIVDGATIIDCGGFWGDYAGEVLKKTSCRIIIFEPVPEYAEKCKERFAGDKRVRVYTAGAGRAGTARIYLNGVGSSVYGSGNFIQSDIVNVSDYIQNRIDVLKMNCEGAEYDVIEELDEKGLLGNIREIVVQFHLFPGGRYDKVQEILQKTHELAYRKYWEIWQKKSS